MKQHITGPLTMRWQLYNRLREMGMSSKEKLEIGSPLNGKTIEEKEKIAKEILERLEKEKTSTK